MFKNVQDTYECKTLNNDTNSFDFEVNVTLGLEGTIYVDKIGLMAPMNNRVNV